MKRQPVESSTIKSIGYNEKTSTLEIEFKKRDGSFSAIWQYSPISPQEHTDLINADSIGQHFHTNIRDNNSLTSNRIK